MVSKLMSKEQLISKAAYAYNLFMQETGSPARACLPWSDLPPIVQEGWISVVVAVWSDGYAAAEKGEPQILQ